MRFKEGKKLFICILGLVLLVFAGYKLVTQLSDYLKSSNLYENAVEEYVTVKVDEINGGKTDWKDLVDIDLAKLQEQNKDVVGWIFFENIDISYPVLYSGDDVEYLKKSYTGEYISAGSIFMEGENTNDFSDVHTILYGHSMKDFSMFGKLRYYASEPDYINSREYFQIITDKEKYRYKIISYKIIPDDHDIYTVYKKGGPDYVTFVNDVILNGLYVNKDDIIKHDDHIITLSTCSGDKRLVVSALRCDTAPLSK